jgi:aspartate-semialdehyde dehydrogenase
MALHGLFEQGWVEWLSAMTYQAASGAGAANMRELVAQMKAIGDDAADLLAEPGSAALALDGQVRATLDSDGFPSARFGAPLAANLIPWIDVKMEGGETKEEWKAYVEANKILGTAEPVPIDGICVRVGSMRCHSQAFTVKLRQDIPLDEIQEVLDSANAWVSVVENEPARTLAALSPAAVTGSMNIPVGRIRKLRMGPQYLGCFSVGDQLLWGAAEPLRRVLGILRQQG